jgi:hypothetical protein
MHRLKYMPYRTALQWVDGSQERAELVARAKGYKPGLAYYAVKQRATDEFVDAE